MQGQYDSTWGARKYYWWEEKKRAFWLWGWSSVLEYDEITTEDLNLLTKEWYVVAEPFYMVMDPSPAAIRNKLWLQHNWLVLLQGGNLKSIIWRIHCRARTEYDINHRIPIFHKKGGLWIRKIKRRFKYRGEYKGEKDVDKYTIMLGEHLDKGFIHIKNTGHRTPFDPSEYEREDLAYNPEDGIIE